jgi:hypothetical protein
MSYINKYDRTFNNLWLWDRLHQGGVGQETGQSLAVVTTQNMWVAISSMLSICKHLLGKKLYFEII